MCGLVGIYDTRAPGVIDRAMLERMNQRQHHRGPDEDGIHVEPGVGLGHKRLSIIDLASGQQPLCNEDETVWVAYNGEIYNFPELTDELKACGHRFRTHCDTEVIVHAWEEWGEACVERFRGMFAFALWDRNRQTLFLARDRLGIKPLFYALLPNGSLIFGSELKALQVHPDLPRQLDEQAVEDYLGFGYVPEPRTIYRDVLKLPPGHTLIWRRGGGRPEPRAYWDVSFQNQQAMSESDAQAELLARIEEAVRIRLVAEVPLGAFLSGGVDSGSVVASMAGLSKEPVNTCTIGFGEPEFNEADHARAVADRYATNHQEQRVDPDDYSLLDQLADLYDEPYADSSAIPTYRVCELARQRVIVALSGDGGDENLAGYKRYGWFLNEERKRNLLPQSLRKAIFGPLGQLYPDMPGAPRVLRARATFQDLAADPIDGYFRLIGVMKDDERLGFYRPEFLRRLDGYRAQQVLRRHAERAPVDDSLSLVQYLDLKTYLPGDILTKVDRASMAHALEVRVPLLDHPLVEWLAGLKPELKRQGDNGKKILKQAMEPRLPHDILYRPKQGFGVPLASWFRGPLRQRVRDALLGDTLQDLGIFERRRLEQLVDEHTRGVRDRSSAIWSLLMFEAWARREAA